MLKTNFNSSTNKNSVGFEKSVGNNKPLYILDNFSILRYQELNFVVMLHGKHCVGRD